MAEPSDVPSVMNWRYPSTGLYDTYMSGYNDGILFNAQQVMCQGNLTGTNLQYAQENMYDLSMVNEYALEENCNIPDTVPQPNYFEVEYFTFNEDTKSFDGPFFYWSYPRANSVQYQNAWGFFWDESNLKDHGCININNVTRTMSHNLFEITGSKIGFFQALTNHDIESGYLLHR